MRILDQTNPVAEWIRKRCHLDRVPQVPDNRHKLVCLPENCRVSK